MGWLKFSAFNMANWIDETQIVVQRMDLHWNRVHLHRKYHAHLEIEVQGTQHGALSQVN